LAKSSKANDFFVVCLFIEYYIIYFFINIVDNVIGGGKNRGIWIFLLKLGHKKKRLV